MRQRFKRWGALCAFGFGVLTLVLAFVPILFPITVALGALTIVSAGALLFFEERAAGRKVSLPALPAVLRNPDERDLSPVALRSVRALRLALIGIAWNCVLYLLLGVHSWLCYVRSFDRELEPIRKVFRVIASEPLPGHQSAPPGPKSAPRQSDGAPNGASSPGPTPPGPAPSGAPQ